MSPRARVMALAACAAAAAAGCEGCGGGWSGGDPVQGNSGVFAVATAGGVQKLFLPMPDPLPSGNAWLAVVDPEAAGNGTAGAPALTAAPPDTPGGGRENGTNLANLTGFPDLIVPAGFTGDRLPVGLSFFGPAFSEPKLLALGYAFEQATHARRRPVTTPGLPGESWGK